MDDETDWQRQLLVGLTVLVAVGALIGGIVALISIKAADYAGIDGGGTATSPSTGRWSEPSEDTPTSDEEPEGPGTSSGTSSTPPPSEPTKKPPRDKGITLVATPTSVSTYDRINLQGTYSGGAGATLQVQRKESGQWVDFPTSATVNGRTFETYIETGRSGPNTFRVKEIGESKTSNPVTVRVS